MKTPRTMEPHLIPLLTLASSPLCLGDLVVDVDLGVLTDGVTEITGTTARTQIDPGPPAVFTGGNNNASNYRGLPLNPAADWGNEIVYRFEIEEGAEINLRTVEWTGDPDFFLLNSLETVFDADTGKDVATGGIGNLFMDDPPPQSDTFGDQGAGVYYLSVENWTLNGDSTFTVELFVGTPPPPPPPPPPADPPTEFIDLGDIVAPDEPFSLDTFGSGFDTELGLYDGIGQLLANNDDAVGLQSELVFDVGLPAGTYYLASGSYNTAFLPEFGVTSGAPGGDLILNHPGSPDPTNVNFGGGVAQWFRFTIGGGSGPTVDGIQITSVVFDPILQEFTVSWVSSSPGEFNVHMGTAAQMEEAASGNGVMPLVVSEVTSPVTVPVPVADQGADKYFLQISQ